MSERDDSRSFYFFDFDDNAMFLETPLFVRNKVTGAAKEVSTSAFATIRERLGAPGPWEHFEIYEGTFSHFDDIPPEEMTNGRKQYFVEDIEAAIDQPPEKWQAPAWPLLAYASEKQRPLAIVTARGHSRDTIRSGVQALVDRGFLAATPNFLEIYAVGNAGMAEELLDSVADDAERERIRALKDRTSALKRLAIHNIVEKALAVYGAEPEHRFGMSDDDPMNVSLIIKAMCDCKEKYMDKRFFVINTHQGEHVKLEVFPANFPVTRKADLDEIVS